ncbi:MAG: hypothetical protein LUC33_06745 [Prevotellaceae bacterium]|nr:hypothetical protein [Prevotellaceae bacterium]
MTRDRLIPLSRIKPTRKSEYEWEKGAGDRERGQSVLMEAQQYWYAMARFRADRERNKRYVFGDQWGDVIETSCGRMTEAEYLRREGNTPMKQNMIRRLLRNVIGFWRNQNNEPICASRVRDEQLYAEVMTTLLQYNHQLNDMDELNAREMEEFLISSLVCEKNWCGWKNGRMDCWTDMVPTTNLVIDCNMRDPRGEDCQFVAELHDVEFGTLCEKFAHSAKDVNGLKDMYAHARTRSAFSTKWAEFGYSEPRDWDFFMSREYTRCRVVEVWRRESRPRYRCHDWNSGEVFKIETRDKAAMVDAENRERLEAGARLGMPREEIPLIDCEWFVDSVWYYYFLSPFGDILDEGETPYEHKSHPYVFKAYPFVDGEIHSFVSDVIDQQRMINRLVTMYDMAIRSSAKGLMMIPREAIPEGMSPEQFAEMATSYRGMVFYKSKGLQHLPQVITSNSTNIGLTELLQLQMKMMEDISGVHGALQGKTPTSGTSGTLYAQQADNATTSLVDVVMSFDSFVLQAARKRVRNIQQYYDGRRVMEIAGDQMPETGTPDKVMNMDFDLSIHEARRTAAYRESANQMLLQVFQSGQITLPQMLKAGSFEFADDLLKIIESDELKAQQQQAQQQAQAGQQPMELPPESQPLQWNVNPRQALENGQGNG